ncbi:MAG TPA: hypothetical protein VGM52_08185 [Herbaspirillum sp.]|jgi:hypothetical protein
MMHHINPAEISKLYNVAHIATSVPPVSIQTSGLSISNLIGGLHLNLTQPECNSPVGGLPRS